MARKNYPFVRNFLTPVCLVTFLWVYPIFNGFSSYKRPTRERRIKDC